MILFEGWSQENPPDLYFNHYFEKFSITNISSIVQDTSGFLWIGTAAGLNRFDGQDFHTFESSQSNATSITDNRVNDLLIDNQGKLWIATYQDLLWFDEGAFAFHVVDRVDDPTLEIDALALEEDDQGVLWIGTLHGLYRTNATTEYLERPGGPFKNLQEDEVNDLMFDSRERMWIGTNRKLARYEGDNLEVVLEDVDVTSIAELDDVIWVGTRFNGLYKLSGKGEELGHYSLKAASVEGNSNRIFDILINQEGQLWVGTEIGGLQLYQPDTDDFFAYTKGLDDGSLKSNSIWEVFEDQSGRLWLGTNNQGVFVRDRDYSKFDRTTPARGQTQQLKFGTVSAFLPNENGLWIGTDGGGISVYDSLTGMYSFFDKSAKGGGLGSDEVLSFFRDSDGVIWTGNWGGGLNRFDPATKSFQFYLNEENNPQSLGSNNVFAIREDRNGRLWCTTWGKGLSRLDKKSGTFTHIGYEQNNPDYLSSNLTYDLEIDQAGALWVATVLGLDKVIIEKDTFRVEHFTNQEGDSTSLSSHNVNSILIDSRQNIWVGTKYGLNIMAADQKGFQRFFKEDGLSDNDIKSVTEDDNGSFWIATGKGLTRMTRESDQWSFEIFDESDGILSREFFNNSGFKSSDGKILLGGLNGFNHFYPDLVVKDMNPPKVHFTDFKLFNRSIKPGPETPLNSHINQTKKITLNHKQSIFTIDYLSIHFTHADKNQFAYIMDGFETDWNYVGTLKQATYTNLDPGVYTFKVKSANHDGFWGEERSLLIEVMPPWWETPLFRLLIGFGVISVLLSIYYLRVSFLKRQRARLQSEVNRQTYELKATNDELQRLGKFKEAITGMLVHDLKNPLHLILGLSDEKGSKDMKEINLSGRRMLYMVTNMLDVQKFEETTMKLDEKEFDLNTLIEDARSQFELILKSKSLVFVNQVQSHHVRGDVELLSRVMQNLLSNAAKYTDFAGTITVNSKEEGERVLVEVSDTGVGIDQKHQVRIFEKFHQIDPKDLGGTSSTGLGLTFCKMAVNAHGGEIGVRSELGKGATFYFDIARSDNQKIDSAAAAMDSGRDGLSEDELNSIRKVMPDLAELRLYEVSKIEALMDQIEDTEQIRQWKAALKTAAYHWDEERYRKLTTL